MSFSYAVLGAGRQGTAAAYDLARWGEVRSLVVADYNVEMARRAADRINRLVGRAAAEAAQLDAKNPASLDRVLAGVDATLSAVPYSLNLEVTRAALRARSHVCDLGGHLGIARQQHAFDAEARRAGISII